MNMVSIADYVPDIIIDMRYASTRNIMQQAVSNDTTPRIVRPAAEALQTIANDLRGRGIRLVIWDAYRTPEVQAKLRIIVTDNRYVLEDSKHCQGLALDITLADLQGSLLDMGTDHDDFTDQAHANAISITDLQLQNRILLATSMEQHGYFAQWPYEWWHFDYLV